MKFCVVGLFIFSLFCLVSFSTTLDKQSLSKSRKFFVYRTNSITQRACTCGMSFSCSCCEHVVIVYQKGGKRLCVNFTYQRNGLNVDISLNSDIIKNISITNYKSFRSCVSVPRCFFSTVCANVLELNQFPRSITACLRLDILAKKERWQINYNCVSISTDLPSMSPNMTMSAEPTVAMSTEATMMQTDSMTSPMTTEQMSTTVAMTAEETTATLEILERTEESAMSSEMTTSSGAAEMTTMPTEMMSTDTPEMTTVRETMSPEMPTEVATEMPPMSTDMSTFAEMSAMTTEMLDTSTDMSTLPIEISTSVEVTDTPGDMLTLSA